MRHGINYLIYSLIIVFVTACGGGSGGTTVTNITSFEASATTIAEGSSVNLTAVFTNGTASINNGVGGVSSNVAKSVKPTATTTYTLKVTNALGASITSSVKVTVLPAYNIFPPNFFDGTYNNGTVNFEGSDDDGAGVAHTATLLEKSGTSNTTFDSQSVNTIDETLIITKSGTSSAGGLSHQYWTTDLNNLKYVGYYVGVNDVATATSSSIMPITTYIGASGTMGTYERSDGSTFKITWQLVDDTSGPNKAKYITTTVSRDGSVNDTLLYTATVTSFINQAGTISSQNIVIVYHDETPERTLTLTSIP